MIRSTFAGFSMAQLALSANQKALDVTGQNLSNINTEGYTRQRLDLVSISPQQAGSFSSPNDVKVGMGVMMTGVSQIRDPFLDTQYRNQLTKVGTSDAINNILTDIGNIFDESDKSAIKEQLSDIVSQLDKLSQPGQSSDDNIVRSSFEVLINYIHQNAEDLATVKDKVVDKIQDSNLADVKEILDNIKNLNESIKQSQILGDPALELQDQRNLLLDDLSTYLPIKVETEKIDMGGGIYVDKLKVTFTGSNNTNIPLVDDDKVATIAVEEVNGEYDLKITGAGQTQEQVVTDSLKDGILKGSLDMLNERGVFDGSTTNGIGFYEDTFNAFVNTLAIKMNELNGVEYEKDAGGNYVTNSDGSYKIVNGEDNALFTTSDGKAFTASNIQISEKWAKGEISIKRADAGAGSTANETILQMVELLSDKEVVLIKPDGKLTGSTKSLFDGYGDIQSTYAIDKKSYESLLQNHTTVAQQAATSRESVTGVNMDEEVMNMMKYQQSYNAASRLMTTLDALLDKLINGTGVI